jgi:hypothetical protein
MGAGNCRRFAQMNALGEIGMVIDTRSALPHGGGYIYSIGCFLCYLGDFVCLFRMYCSGICEAALADG